MFPASLFPDILFPAAVFPHVGAEPGPPPPPTGIPTALRGAVMDVTFVDPSRTAVADL